jgi:hypothetical protein
MQRPGCAMQPGMKATIRLIIVALVSRLVFAG